MFGNEYVAV